MEYYMISAKELTKIFGTNREVDRISLDIPEGMMFGLLGTNGAGKTTLLRLLSGIPEPDSGEILVDDKPLSAAAEKIFYLPDTPYYFPNASMEQMTKFYQSQYPKMDTEGVSHNVQRDRIISGKRAGGCSFSIGDRILPFSCCYSGILWQTYEKGGT